jgi:hypothetical protein
MDALRPYSYFCYRSKRESLVVVSQGVGRRLGKSSKPQHGRQVYKCRHLSGIGCVFISTTRLGMREESVTRSLAANGISMSYFCVEAAKRAGGHLRPKVVDSYILGSL